MLCKDCEHFRIRYEPLKVGKDIWDFGMAQCDKYQMVVEFASRRKINKLKCIDDEKEE